MRALVLLTLACGWGESCCAEIFIEHVFPPCIQPGQTTHITLVGSDLQDATALWTTLPTGSVKSQWIRSDETGVTFAVEIPSDARPGLYGLRVATPSGLSNVHLFAVDDLPIVVESETAGAKAGTAEIGPSNNSLDRAQAVAIPAVVVGTSPASDIDCYAIEVTAGQRVSFEVVGNRLGKAFDPLVKIFDSNGRSVIERDNDVGLFFDNRFEHTFKEAGRHYVRLTDTRYHGSRHWTYMLRMGRFPAARVAIPSTVQAGAHAVLHFPELGTGRREFEVPANLQGARFFFGLRRDGDEGSAWFPLSVSRLTNAMESEPNNMQMSATPATVPCNLHGSIDGPGDEDWFAMYLRKGDRLVFRSETQTIGSPADLELVLFGPGEKELRRSDDSSFDDAKFTLTAPADGKYHLQVSEVVRKGGPAYAYRVEVQRRQPALQLTSQIGRLAIPRGTRQPLPLTLARTDFGGPVILSLVGAPTGMTLRETTIPAGENAVTNALVVDPATPVGVYTVQVKASGTTGDSTAEAIARTLPLIDRNPTGRGPHGEAFELREDQRRLPPSLLDRIAVVVLPESPYDFEVMPKLVTLPRYVHADLQIQTQLGPHFEGPVSFVLRGGMLEANRLQAPTVTTEVSTATSERSLVTAKLVSGVNTPLTRHRVTITGTAIQDGRTIHLTRTFELETKIAFSPAAESSQITLHPGETVKLKIAANRIFPFDGSLAISPVAPDGLILPNNIEFVQGQTHVTVELKVATDFKSGKYTVMLPAAARIGKFSERNDGGKLEVIVKEKE
ncbi:MAG: hypothetical protein HON53_15990 [Planctomycetaceae bacterium]|jgi:hypothetical protein|nr:hypothetical protein [Planctomycetaceae bacterium]MBT6486468.1 hypothetical protein [Planctomycetaceae bacterium]